LVGRFSFFEQWNNFRAFPFFRKNNRVARSSREEARKHGKYLLSIPNQKTQFPAKLIRKICPAENVKITFIYNL